MSLPYHDRVQHTSIDGMHTIRDVVVNILDVMRSKKNFRVAKLELSQSSQRIADKRFQDLTIPKWVDLTDQSRIISNPKAMKTHDWKQVYKIA